ncbi:MAG: hypothetical protein ACE5J9_04010, partial [Methanosarcinales archaeon]
MKLKELPIIPETPDEEFVDREAIIEELMHNAVLTKKRVASNTVLIGLRRFGKTAVLQRVYNKLFLEQDAVVPI